MEAERRARAETDRQWRPSRGRSGTSTRTRTSTGSSRAGENPAPGQRSEPRWKPIAMAVAVGTLSGAAAATGVWLLLQPSPQRGAAPTVPGSNTPAVATQATPPAAHVVWRSTDASLQMELLTPTGVVVASSSSASAPAAVPPGEYRLRIRNEDGKWTAPDQTVAAIGGETLTLGLSGELLAKYHTWSGNQASEKNQKSKAEKEWRAAIAADANNPEPRLQLAAQLAVHKQYREARQQVQEVLDRNPGNEQALRLQQLLGQLGK